METQTQAQTTIQSVTQTTATSANSSAHAAQMPALPTTQASISSQPQITSASPSTLLTGESHSLKPNISNTADSFDSSNASNWRMKISDATLREHPSLASIQDLDGLVKSYVNAQKLIGAEKVALPNEKWTDAEWNEFFNKMGRPKTAEGYQFTRPQMPEGIDYDEAMHEHFFNEMHTAGLSQRQAEKLYNTFNEYQLKQFEKHQMDHERQCEAAIENLKKEWNRFFDTKLNHARLAVKTFGGPTLQNKLDTTGLGNDPDIIKAFAEMGAILAEDTTHGAARTSFTANPESAKAEINNLNLDSDFMKALTDRNHMGHAAALEKWKQLHTLAYPGK